MAHRKVPTPVVPSNSLVASAVRYSGSVPRLYTGSQNWQRECYRHYRICGEARFAANFYGNALSRATLGVGTRGTSGVKWATDGQGKALLDQLFNGRYGQAQMLKSIGVHLAIAGECYLVGRSVKGTEYAEPGDLWEILSVEEISVTGKKWSIKYDDKTAPIELADSDVVIRIWMPDPAQRMQADSPFRSLLSILKEIEWSTLSIFAQNSSRLTGAGLLVMPQGMTFPPPPDINGVPQEYANEADGFMMALANGMMQAIDDPSSPAARVPLIVTAPGEHINDIRLIHFWSELDAQSIEQRAEAIRRFALGMDLPPEQILGMSSNGGTGGGTSNGVSHWGAWQIEEATIKMHIEPMLDVVANALTVSYVRPLVPETQEEVVYDTAALRLRPDRSKEAMELGDRGLLKPSVVLRENGFDPVTDMTDPEELKQWLLRKVASGSATPEQVGAALKELGVDLPMPEGYGGAAQLPQPPSVSETEDEDDTEYEDGDDEYWDYYIRNGRRYRRRKPQRQARPDPSLEDHPTRPRTPAESSALVAACDGLVWRALEKAGNRVLNSGVRGKNRDKSIEPTEFYLQTQVNGEGPELLDNAFAYAPRILGEIEEFDKVVTSLRDYCLVLFATQTPHSRQTLAEWLSLRGLTERPEAKEPPMMVNVTVEGSTTPVNVHLPEGLVQMAAQEIAAPKVEVTNHVPIPTVTVENQVNPTPVNVAAPNVEIENVVQTPNVTVEAPNVEVAAPNVTVEAAQVSVEPHIEVKPAPVKVMNEGPKKSRVLRDSSGRITGVEEVE